MRGIFLFLILIFSIASYAEERAEKPGVRLEDEVTLAVLPKDTERLWKFLKQHFKDKATIADMHFQTVESVEHFIDTYFDTEDRRLVKQWAGLRFRHRIGERGEIKELIQLKVTPNLTNNNIDIPLELRNEIKFKPAVGVGGDGEVSQSSPLLSFLKTKDLPRFREALHGLGVSPEDLKYLLTIRQERRRIYFRQGDKQFFTLTLDIFDGNKGWFKDRLTQLEVEIGENLFTGATSAEKEKYLTMQAELRSIVSKHFYLQANQTPKVVQMYDLLSKQGFFSKIYLKFDQLTIFLFLIPLFIALFFFTYRENARA